MQSVNIQAILNVYLCKVVKLQILTQQTCHGILGSPVPSPFKGGFNKNSLLK